MTDEQLRTLVAQAPFGRDLDDAEVHALVAFAEVESAEVGTLILSEGQPAPGLLVLAEGEVEVVKRGDDGQLHQLAVLGPGATLGESGITGIHGASATVRVTQPVRYLLVRGDAFARLIDAHPRVAAKIALAIARVENHRLHRMNVKVLDLLGQANDGRRLEDLARFREQLFANWDF